MNSAKKFFLGFVVGMCIGYWYLNYADLARNDTIQWFSGTASNMRRDKMRDAANDVVH